MRVTIGDLDRQIDALRTQRSTLVRHTVEMSACRRCPHIRFAIEANGTTARCADRQNAAYNQVIWQVTACKRWRK